MRYKGKEMCGSRFRIEEYCNVVYGVEDGFGCCIYGFGEAYERENTEELWNVLEKVRSGGVPSKLG